MQINHSTEDPFSKCLKLRERTTSLAAFEADVERHAEAEGSEEAVAAIATEEDSWVDEVVLLEEGVGVLVAELLVVTLMVFITPLVEQFGLT